MEFCKDCGGVLNLFGKNNSGLCSSCIQHAKPTEAVQTPTIPANGTDLLLDSTISYENEKIILRSKEGWELWSGSANKKTAMTDVLKAARLIYTIRKKRKKKQ
jgi:hypothetical protein